MQVAAAKAAADIDRKQRVRSLHRQGRAGQGRAGQGRAGQGRAGQGRAGQGRAGQGRAGQGTFMLSNVVEQRLSPAS